MPRQPACAPARLMDVDLRLLKVFRAVVESGGFSAAEVELNIGRSTISTHMAELEARLDMRLCERGRGGFALTEEGRVVYEASRKLFAGLEDFRAEVGAARGRLTGELNIGVIDNTVTDPNSRLADAIARFKARGAETHITMQVASPNEIERGVLDGRLHVGVSAFFHRLPGLSYGELYRERMVPFCGRDNPLFRLAPDDLSLEDLARSDYAARGYMGSERLSRLPAAPGPAATAYHMEGMAMLILSGRYFGYLPTHYAASWVARDLMRPLRPDVLGYDSPFQVVTRKGVRPTLALQTFLDELRRLYAAPGPAAEPAALAPAV